MRPVQYGLGFLLMALIAGSAAAVAPVDPNSAPNPYREDSGWAKHGAGRNFGSTPALALDPDGRTLWVVDRCGGQTCDGSNIDPITRYDASGRVLTTFGSQMFVRPHGVYVDKDG